MDTTNEVLALQEQIKASGMTVDAVLQKAGIDRSTWTRWKAGTTVPRLDNWRAMEKALDELSSAESDKAVAS